MGLREQLREKACDALPYFDRILRLRGVVLLWDETDGEADQLCRQVIGSAFRTLPNLCFPIGPEKSMNACLDELCRQYAAGALHYSHGLYLLWVGCPKDGLPTALERLRSNRVSFILDTCALDTEPDGMRRPAEGARCLWHIVPGQVNSTDALAVLLMTGAFLRELPIDGAGDIRAFRVSSVLHNSVERDLAFQLREKLKTILYGSTLDWQESFESDFSLPSLERGCILNSIPHLEDLPVVGNLRDIFAMSRSTAEAEKRFPFYNRSSDSHVQLEQESGIDISDALSFLYGRMGDLNVSEWLLEQVLAASYKRCEECAAKLRLKELCWHLPVNVLLQTAAPYAEFLHKKACRELMEAKKKCEDALHQRFSPRGPQLARMLEGLTPYLKQWEKCVERGLEAAWWDVVKRLVCNNEVKETAQKKWNTIQSDLAAIRSETACRTSFGRDSWNLDWRDVTAEEILAGLFSREEFRDEDLASLITSAQLKADSAVDVQLFGQTLLFFDQESMYRLEEIRDTHGGILLDSRSGGWFAGHSATGSLRVVPVPSLGAYTMWEARFESEPVQLEDEHDGRN